MDSQQVHADDSSIVKIVKTMDFVWILDRLRMRIRVCRDSGSGLVRSGSDSNKRNRME